MNVHSLKNSLHLFCSTRMIFILILGFPSGLPLALTGGTLQAWLTDAQIDLPSIGTFALVGIPYTLKFLWAPLIDEWIPPLFGRRRGWALFSQLGLVASLITLGLCNPTTSLLQMGICAILVVFFSATQDIVLDAWRTELLKDEEYGAGAGMYVMGYRLAMVVSGAFALYLADSREGLGLSWDMVYVVMASFLSIGIIATLFGPEPGKQPSITSSKLDLSFRQRVVLPFVEFFNRPAALSIISFVTVYKLSTMMATSLTTTFLMSLDYSKTDIGTVSKVYGLIATILGTLVGGALMSKLSLKRALWIFGILQAIGGLSFLLLLLTGKSMLMLILVLSVENFLIGLGVAAISGFMMTICSKQFTGTQFALLSSFTAVSRVVLVSQAGSLATAFGWWNFYLFSVSLAAPGLLLLTQYDSWIASTPAEELSKRISSYEKILMTLFLGGLVLISAAPLLTLFKTLSPHTTTLAQGGAFLFCAGLVGGFIKRK